MTISRRFIPVASLIFVLCAVASLAAQNKQSDKEITWFDALDNQRTVVEPQKLELLSIQVSKLPRDTFGHGKPPSGNGFVSSFLAASGTGIFGVFEVESESDLKFREDMSSLERFTDDRGKNLMENPGEDEINEFFDANKQLSVKLSVDQSKAVFTLRGYSTPVAGAESLSAKAKVTFLSLSKVESATIKTKLFGTTDKIEVGPVAFRVAKNSDRSVLPTRIRRWSGDNKKEWALLMDSRQKPVKSVEVLDVQGNVLWKIGGMPFDGQSYVQYMEHPDAEPNAVRVTWYEKWELITVPIEIKTPLGI